MAKTKQGTQASQSKKTGQASKGTPSTKPVSKGKGPAKKQVKKERGGLLSTLLVLIMLHGIFATYLAFTNLKADYANQKTLILAAFFLISAADVAAAFGMWHERASPDRRFNLDRIGCYRGRASRHPHPSILEYSPILFWAIVPQNLQPVLRFSVGAIGMGVYLAGADALES
jgi:hypothetical protein